MRGVEAALPRLRLAAESLMVDTCVVKRQTGSTYNPVSMLDEPTYTTVYTGKCRLRVQSQWTTATPDVGGMERGVNRWEVHLPVEGTETIRRGDVVEVTAATYDSSLQGRTFRVAGPHTATAATARRLPVEAEVD